MRWILPLLLLIGPYLGSVPSAICTPRSYDLISDGEVKVSLPLKPLAAEAIEIRSLSNRQHFSSWNVQDHSASYDFLQRLERNYYPSYTVHGKTTPALQGEMFTWQLVPKNSCLAGWVKTGQTFYRTTFESASDMPALEDKHWEVVQALKRPAPPLPDEEPQCDPFCDPVVIQRQLIWEGKTVWLLRDYSQNLLIGDTPHFLIIPKKHRTTFSNLSREEYIETMETAQKIAHYFAHHFPDSTLHIYHNNGEKAGQVVPHWHLHLVAIKEDAGIIKPPLSYRTHWVNTVSSLCGKWRQFFCLTLPRRGLSSQELRDEVAYWKKEFKNNFRS